MSDYDTNFEWAAIMADMDRRRANAEREVLLRIGGSDLLASMDEHERSYAEFTSAVTRMFSDGSPQQIQEYANYVAENATRVAMGRRWYMEVKRRASELIMPSAIVIPGGL